MNNELAEERFLEAVERDYGDTYFLDAAKSAIEAAANEGTYNAAIRSLMGSIEALKDILDMARTIL